MVNTARLKKLKWMCRRGMKELDVLLERFLEDNEAQLNRGDWPEFEEFLAAEDDCLWDWLQNPDHPDAARFLMLSTQILYGTATAH